MIPIKDLNPTTRPAVLTILIIAACVGIYFFVQQAPSNRIVDTPQGQVEVSPEVGNTLFNLEWAAIPCEVVTGDALDAREVTALTRGQDDACTSDGGPAVFPDKNVYAAVLVSMFLHGGVLHLAGNMLFLWIFGNNIEDRLGWLRFALFYLLGGVAATVAHIAVQPSSVVPVVGASGAIAAVMGAYLIWFPNAPVMSWVFPVFFFPISAKWFLAIWFVLQFFTNPNAGVAWVAHVGGFVFGVVVGLVVRTNDRAGARVFRPGHQPDWYGSRQRPPW